MISASIVKEKNPLNSSLAEQLKIRKKTGHNQLHGKLNENSRNLDIVCGVCVFGSCNCKYFTGSNYTCYNCGHHLRFH
jgi:hypothetical protein